MLHFPEDSEVTISERWHYTSLGLPQLYSFTSSFSDRADAVDCNATAAQPHTVAAPLVTRQLAQHSGLHVDACFPHTARGHGRITLPSRDLTAAPPQQAARSPSRLGHPDALVSSAGQTLLRPRSHVRLSPQPLSPLYIPLRLCDVAYGTWSGATTWRRSMPPISHCQNLATSLLVHCQAKPHARHQSSEPGGPSLMTGVLKAGPLPPLARHAPPRRGRPSGPLCRHRRAERLAEGRGLYAFAVAFCLDRHCAIHSSASFAPSAAATPFCTPSDVSVSRERATAVPYVDTRAAPTGTAPKGSSAGI